MGALLLIWGFALILQEQQGQGICIFPSPAALVFVVLESYFTNVIT